MQPGDTEKIAATVDITIPSHDECAVFWWILDTSLEVMYQKRPWIIQLFDPAVFIMIGWVMLILHTCFFVTMDHHSDFNSRKQLHNPQKTAILHIFWGANGSIIFHPPWAVAPWRDMWPMWNFLGVLELRATTDGRQVSDSTPNHPIVMDDHDFVLNHVATWGTPILRNLRHFLVADEMLQLMAVQKPEGPAWSKNSVATWACSWRIMMDPTGEEGITSPQPGLFLVVPNDITLLRKY